MKIYGVYTVPPFRCMVYTLLLHLDVWCVRCASVKMYCKNRSLQLLQMCLCVLVQCNLWLISCTVKTVKVDHAGACLSLCYEAVFSHTHMHTRAQTHTQRKATMPDL